MQAIRVDAFGAPSVLGLSEVAEPVAGPGQVVVRVRAIGVNPVETYVRSGQYAALPGLPYTPGSDGAGEIVSAGQGSGFEIGTRVFVAGSVSGTYAELALCEARDVYALPPRVSFEAGAALGIPYATAHRALFGRANAKAGEFVFVHGATGGVGVAAVQLARRAGCEVGGSAGSLSGESFLASLGVRYTANHNESGYLSDVLGMTCGRGADVIVEMLANANLGADGGVLAPGGRIVVVGSRGEACVDARDWMKRDASVLGMMLANASAEEKRAIYLDIIQGLEEGALSPVVSERFPLSEAARAHERVLKGESRGKIVLVP